MTYSSFEWDAEKDLANQRKHKVSFHEAQFAFLDPARVLAREVSHSTRRETRYYCFGRVDDDVLTVRFTYRGETVRIIGAGYWRKGRRIYETENKIQR